MTLRLKTVLRSLLLTFAVAAAGGIVTYLGMSGFQTAKQPPLSPPAFLFPVVWTLLFAIMAFGAAVVYDSGNKNAPKALFVYALQLIMNFWWCVLFFGFRLYPAAFIWLLLLWTAVFVMTIMFTRINRLAGLLQILYLVWLAFAAYLNLGVWLLNP